MKNRTLSAKSIVFFLIVLFGASIQNIFAQEETKPFSINESPLPAPTEPVNDFAGVIDDATERQLNQKIKDFKAKTNPQVVLAVAVVKTTGGRPIFDYALAVARGWKVGTNEADNPSALLFIAVDDREYFTLVSKDLQDELPDGLAGQLQRQYLVPAFKQGNYSKGVADTIDAYIRTIEAKQTGKPLPTGGETNQTKKEEKPSVSFGLCLIGLVILMIIIFSRAGKSGRGGNDRDGWGGGGFGGGSALPWIVGSIIANSGGSGGSSSGGSSSGGGDWGGFGGGGDFDGGGAGGDW